MLRCSHEAEPLWSLNDSVSFLEDITAPGPCLGLILRQPAQPALPYGGLSDY